MNEEDQIITVKKAAEVLGCCAETLRRWEKKGLLETKRHPFNGYRVYKLSQVLLLRHRIEEGGRSVS